MAQLTTNTFGARTQSSCLVSTLRIRRAHRVHAHPCVRWRATFVACPEIVRRLRLQERRPTCARMGSEESTLQTGIVGTCANVEYRAADAMRGPFSWAPLLSIHISHLRRDRCAFVDCRVRSFGSSWPTQQVRLPTVAGGPLRQQGWSAVAMRRCRSRSDRSLHTFYSRLL